IALIESFEQLDELADPVLHLDALALELVDLALERLACLLAFRRRCFLLLERGQFLLRLGQGALCLLRLLAERAVLLAEARHQIGGLRDFFFEQREAVIHDFHSLLRWIACAARALTTRSTDCWTSSPV